jgi:4-amino-4-deoxy-L-arabinose transferase-like glycosyltransferase
VFFVLGWKRFDSVGGDPFWFHEGANLLADGRGFLHVFRFVGSGVVEPGADHPPAYLVALAIPSLFGLRSLLDHQLWSCLIGATAVVFAGLAGARLGNRRTALLAAALVAVTPTIWVYDGILHSETLAITAITAATWLALRARTEPDWPTVLGLGAALGVLVLARAETILLVPVVVGAALWPHHRRRVAAALGAAAVLVGPWVVANLVRFDNPSTLSTQLGTTLLHANCDAVYYGPQIGWWNYACAASLPLPPGDASVSDAFYRRHAIDYVKAHEGRVPVVVAARVGRTFGLFDPLQQVDLDRVEGRPKGVAVAGMLAYYVTAAAAVVGYRRLRRAGRSRRDLADLWAPIALVLLTAVVFYGTTRFRAIAEPALVLLAAAAFTVTPTRPDPEPECAT